MLDNLPDVPLDPLFVVDQMYRKDIRPFKIDLGVGVYRNEQGFCPILDVVKHAELYLQQTQTTKSYIGLAGNPDFIASLSPIVFKSDTQTRVRGIQTPGGGGALRLAGELICLATPSARVWLGLPAWGNYLPTFTAAGLDVRTYSYFDLSTQRLRFDAMMESLALAAPGDVVLLQASCHNPTGADLDRQQWHALAQGIAARGLVPLVDFAYQGFGAELEQDRHGLGIILDAVDEALIAYSCSKNFALYRERAGALFVVGRHSANVARSVSVLTSLARVCWSMPPDHGAAIVHTILSDDALRGQWMGELAIMRRRISSIREALGALLPEAEFLRRQQGMFSTLPIKEEAVVRLREEKAIYMPTSGRINLAGLNQNNLAIFAAAIRCEMERI